MAESRLKNGWRSYRFDQIASMINDRIDYPQEAGVDRYVGLEHLDPESLRIRRWGAPSDVTATKLLFRSGDIIFGRRRVYQRKLAVADFDGICSAHAMVLREKPDVALPEFLPFFMQSDMFMERAKEISVGSLSPTINWKSLAKEEFALPPLDEQRRIVSALNNAVAIQEEFWRLTSAHRNLTKRFMTETFSSLMSLYSSAPLDRFGEATMGRQKAPRFQQGKSPRPYLRVANIGWLTLNLSDLEEMDFTPRELTRYRLQPGDILLTEGDLISEFNVGRPAIFEGGVEDCCFQNTLIRLRPNNGVPPLFLLLLLEGARLSQLFAKVAKTTTVTHLGLGRFKELRLPLPPPDVQSGLAEQVSLLLGARRVVEQRSRAIAEVFRQLLAEALS